MKGVFIILDGVADEPCQSLGERTPLEQAKTPNLDAIARKSRIEHCFVIKEGVAPESSSAIISLLGYEPTAAPRGPLEALGIGITLKKGDLALRTNFATVDDLENGNVLDSRAGRTLTTQEAEILAKAINEKVKLRYKFKFYTSIQHRGVLVLKGGFSDNISNADPFYENGNVRMTVNTKMVFSKSLDDEDDSKLSAELVNQFVRESHKVLDKHPINIARAKKGLYAANVVLCRDAGNEPAGFSKLKGKWIGLGYMPLEIGIESACKMPVYKFKYPRLKGIDVYANLNEGLGLAVKNAIKMIKKNFRKTDYFYVHLKETDIPGHDNKPLEKAKMIEFIDEKFFSFLKEFIKKYPARVIVTADHTTACRKKMHTDEPVPVLVYHPTWDENREKRFTEAEGKKGKKIYGKELLKEYLF